MAQKKNPTIADLKRRLIDAIRVLSAEGVLDGSGHLSVKIPGTETFLINPRYAGILADPADLCAVDFSGKRIAGKEPIPLETPIHSVIYRTRSDVGSVLHCHPRFGILMGLQESGLIPFNRDARMFADGVPVFPDSAGIRTDKLASQMVEAMGDHYAVFLKGHGIVVSERTIEGTAVSAIRLERAARDQLLLASFSPPRPLTDGARGRIRSRMDHPYRIWPYLLYQHGIRSKKEAKRLTRSMMKNIWPDEVP
ncbi:MAG TPA: class II aldolase/adducin family protein [Candidatus Binatia bacterium]|jgi:ribulose-5-phosphate 4-epimerase/fuculose-1-phosphate aldolase